MTQETDRQARLLKAKARLDRAREVVAALADEAEAEMVACCRTDLLDQRDEFADIAADLRAAQAALLRARAKAGRIDGGGITRSGGT